MLLCKPQGKERRKERQRRRQKSLYGFVVTSQYYKIVGVVGSLLLTATSFAFLLLQKAPLYPTFCAVQTPTCSIILLW
jgi:hypothetical protein